MLGEAHDLGLGRRREIRERHELGVLGLLDVGLDRPAVGQRSGKPRRSLIRSTMSSENVSPSSSACTCDSAAV